MCCRVLWPETELLGGEKRVSVKISEESVVYNFFENFGESAK